MRRSIACLVLVTALAGCGGDDGAPQTTVTAASSTVTAAMASTSPSSTSAGATTTTTAPVPWVPAGLQFLGGPGQPVGVARLATDQARWSSESMLFEDGDLVFPVLAAGEEGRAVAGLLRGSSAASLEVEVIDAGADLPAPLGYRAARLAVPRDLARDGAVWVMVGGYGLMSPSSASQTGWLGTAESGIIWRSGDGRSWERLGPAAIPGEGTTDLNAVAAVPDGFIAVGYTAALDPFAAPSRGLILISPDGMEWRRAEVSLPYSVELVGAGAVGDRLVVWGIEYACTTHAPSSNSWVSRNERLVVWSSDDGGASWQQAGLGPVAGHAGEAEPPGNPSECPGLSQDEPFAQHLAAAGLVGGRFVVWPTDRAVAFSSTDLVTWTTAEVPGARPERDPEDQVGDSRWSGVLADGETPLLASLEPARDAAGRRYLGFSLQVIAWRLGSDGSWDALPPTRPILMPWGSTSWVFHLQQAGDRAVLSAESSAWVGESGALAPWGSCAAPAAGSDCAFASLAGNDLSGAQLPGIDFSGAVLARLSLAGANLAEASLAGALLDDVDLSGADLTGANLAGVKVGRVDLSGARLSGVDLSYSRFDVYYSVYEGNPVDLRGVDFADAVLRGAGFRDTDLTGADLTGADLGSEAAGDGAHFGSGVICPDGAPADEEAEGPAACRL